MNERVKNKREGVDGLDAYRIDTHFAYPTLLTGRVTEDFAFGNGRSTAGQPFREPVARTLDLANFGRAILGFAMDANAFFHFASLRHYFPKIRSVSQFIDSNAYLGGITVTVRGLRGHVDNLNARQKLDIAQHVLHQIESAVKRESVDFVGTRDFKPHRIRDRFTDRTLKLRIEGEAGRSWRESDVPGLDMIDLSSKDWHVYDDSYGTDQEKHFIRYMNDQSYRLRKHYDDFYLLRNEKAVKLFAFENGQAFEPDFVLFLYKEGDKSTTILQLFIEPKGEQLRQRDDWKEAFLKEIGERGRLETIFQGRDYTVFGLPFFNEAGKENADFKAAFEDRAMKGQAAANRG